MIQLHDFKNLKDLMTRLGDEQACRAYMEICVGAVHPSALIAEQLNPIG